jgi:peptidoglycan/LPS O-acetylase OafA/YrhL
MPSAVTEALFSEPSGRRHALVTFAGVAVFTSVYVYYGVLRDSATVGWLLVMIVGSALSGIAESLPKDRRRIAGALRITAILVLLCVLALTVFAPEVVVGPR